MFYKIELKNTMIVRDVLMNHFYPRTMMNKLLLFIYLVHNQLGECFCYFYEVEG